MRKVLASAIALCACTPDFDSQTRVHDLRVLAIQAEPPEAIAAIQAGPPGAPCSGYVEQVQVTALVVDPGSTGPMSVEGQVCFPTDDGRCAAPSVDLPRRAKPFASVSCAEGAARPSADVPSYCLQAPPSLICGALLDDRLHGFGGIRLQLSLHAYSGDPTRSVWGQKLLVFRAAGTTPNHNPRIDHVEVSRDGVPYDRLEPGGELFVPDANVEIGLWPRLAAGEEGAETYTTIDLSGRSIALTESPRYSFFATDPGDLDRETGDEPLPGAIPPRGLVRLTALRPGRGKAWIVVRDERGGEAWMAFTFCTPGWCGP
jgi:hypothetical protein